MSAIKPNYYRNNDINLIEMWSQLFTRDEFYTIMKSHKVQIYYNYLNQATVVH